MIPSIPVWLLLYIMFGHWIADFVLQSDRMAKGKSTSFYWLTTHVYVYVLFMAFTTAFILGTVFTPGAWTIWLLINGVAHWITDYFTSRCSSHFFKKNDYHNGFVVIGWDQYLHLAFLVVTTVLLMR
jgi:hypothetical protein